MWYNTIPFFVPMDPNMYYIYYLGIKGLDPLIFGRKKAYVVSVMQSNQFHLLSNWCITNILLEFQLLD
jgi:hypothetical protein